MSYLDIKCCKCGSNYFSIRYSTSTAMWSPTIIKDGQIVSSNPNYVTYHCQCIACGTFFDATEHNGVIESIEVINGFAAPSKLSYETAPISVEEASRMASKSAKQWAEAAEESYKERVASIKQKIINLESTLPGNSIIIDKKLSIEEN